MRVFAAERQALALLTMRSKLLGTFAMAFVVACSSHVDTRDLDHMRAHEEMDRDWAIRAANTPLPDHPGVDLVRLGRDLSTRLYLDPAGIKNVSMEVASDQFARMNEPTGATVTVRSVAEPGQPVLLELTFEVVDGKLLFLAAKGRALVAQPAAGDPVATAQARARVLAELGGVESTYDTTTDEKAIRIKFKGTAWRLEEANERTGVFDLTSGALKMYGSPLPPVIARGRAN